MDLREIGWEGVECIQLAQDSGLWQAFVNTVKNLSVLLPRCELVSGAHQHLNNEMFGNRHLRNLNTPSLHCVNTCHCENLVTMLL
jgi:hypothetical protein